MFDNLNLLSCYKRYWNKSDLQNSKQLLKAVKNYNFEDFDYFIDKITDERLKIGEADVDRQILHSNTGKEYFFGPNLNFWVDRVEYTLRNSNNYNKRIQIAIWHYPQITNDKEIKERKLGYDVLLKSISTNVDFLIDFISKLNKPIYLLSNPEIIRILLDNNKFVDFISDKIPVANTDSPLMIGDILRQKIQLNDQMIDWKCGLNFYTCKNNNRHFLPLFGIADDNKIISLLNLKNLFLSDEDYFEIHDKKPIRCLCGNNRLDFKFLPHKNNYPKLFDTNIIKTLDSRYRYLQLIENGNQIEFYYDLLDDNISLNDISLLDSLNVVYKPKQVYKVGHKMPIYWRMSKNDR